jgi:cell division protease FtsH
VAKVTILPRGAALGVSEQLPEFERHLYPESYLTDTLAVRLGGRASEILILKEASTGASNDLADATSIATRMIRERGFSAEVGPIGYGPEGPSRDNPFAGPPLRRGNATGHRPRLLREAEQRGTELLSGTSVHARSSYRTTPRARDDQGRRVGDSVGNSRASRGSRANMGAPCGGDGLWEEAAAITRRVNASSR